MMTTMDHSSGQRTRRFASGQFVPFDGMYSDVWGGLLPLLQGELFPSHREMGDSKWSYTGPLSSGLPDSHQLKSMKGHKMI
jgi:hypothetical protein